MHTHSTTDPYRPSPGLAKLLTDYGISGEDLYTFARHIIDSDAQVYLEWKRFMKELLELPSTSKR